MHILPVAIVKLHNYHLILQSSKGKKTQNQKDKGTVTELLAPRSEGFRVSKRLAVPYGCFRLKNQQTNQPTTISLSPTALRFFWVGAASRWHLSVCDPSAPRSIFI